MTRTVWLCAGLAAGVVLTLGVQFMLRRPKEAARETADQRALAVARVDLAKAREERAKLQMDLDRAELDRATAVNERSEAEARVHVLLEEREAGPVAEAEGARGAAPAAPGAPPTDAEIMKGVGKFGASLQVIFMGGGDEAKKEIGDLFARGGKPMVDLLAAKFEDDATDLGLRVAIVHALAQSGNPDAIASLTKVLADPEAGMLELRLASHGLAFSDAEGIDDALLAVAHRTADTGARANAAFGLARRKNPEGIGLYVKATDEAMANRDPTAIAYLNGFALLGDDALPPLRERLLTYTEPQASITVIEILKGRGDKGALENLRKLAADEGRPASVRKSAEGAIKAIEAGPK